MVLGGCPLLVTKLRLADWNPSFPCDVVVILASTISASEELTGGSAPSYGDWLMRR